MKTREKSTRTGWKHPVGVAAFCISLLISPSQATDLELSIQPIEHYQSLPIGQKIGNLIWRGGLVLNGPTNFGGISGLTFFNENKWIAVTDRGQFISGTLKLDQGHIVGLSDMEMTPIRNSSGSPLPKNYSRDAEAIDTIYREGKAAAVRVSFENLTRVADFDIQDDRPVGAAREVAIPVWLSSLRTNQTLESTCIATNASPIAGSTLLITEDKINAQGAHSAWLLGDRDKGEISLDRHAGLNPTDCVFLPNGDLLVLERGTSFLNFTMQIRQIKASDVYPGAMLKGDVILTGIGSDIDNMEALAIRKATDGSLRIILMSDNNFNDWERTILLEFELPDLN